MIESSSTAGETILSTHTVSQGDGGRLGRPKVKEEKRNNTENTQSIDDYDKLYYNNPH